MATYKAEFLSHYYKGRLRPRSAYAFGLISWWARLASPLPRVANFFTQTSGLQSVAKAIAGVAPQRRIPAFAPQTFTRWFRQRDTTSTGKPVVILWPDTFNNYFHFDITKAAVEVLEATGCQVNVSYCLLSEQRTPKRLLSPTGLVAVSRSPRQRIAKCSIQPRFFIWPFKTRAKGELSMKAQLIHEQQGERTFALIFDKDEEAIEGLQAFAQQWQISAAYLTAVGAFREATLGYFESSNSRSRA